VTSTGGATTSTGGNKSTGGSTSTGGATTSTGGGTTTGGSKSTGGATATGGASPGSGGQSGAAGAAGAGGSGPVNHAPTVNASVDQSVVAAGWPAPISATAADADLPDPVRSLSFSWTAVSGPGTVTFGNAHAIATSASFSVVGPYVLRLSASDGMLMGSSDVKVSVSPPEPCTGLCEKPVEVALDSAWSSGGLGNVAACFQTRTPIKGGNCGNFQSPRRLLVNSTAEPCDVGNWSSLPAARYGGTCIQVSEGDYAWAFLTLW